MAIVIEVHNNVNVMCFETHILSVRETFGLLKENGRFRCYVPELNLFPGLYYINFGLYPLDWAYIYDYHWQTYAIQVLSRNKKKWEVSGVVEVNPTWSDVKKD